MSYYQLYLRHWRRISRVTGIRQYTGWLSMFGKCSWKWMLSCLMSARGSMQRERPGPERWMNNGNWHGRNWPMWLHREGERIWLRCNWLLRISWTTMEKWCGGMEDHESDPLHFGGYSFSYFLFTFYFLISIRSLKISEEEEEEAAIKM